MKKTTMLTTLLAAALAAVGANSVGTATYKIVNNANASTTSGAVEGSAQTDYLPGKAPSLTIYHAYASGSAFSLEANGTRWYAWTDCTDGYQYTVGPQTGHYTVSITCPGKSRPLPGRGATRNGGYAYGE